MAFECGRPSVQLWLLWDEGTVTVPALCPGAGLRTPPCLRTWGTLPGAGTKLTPGKQERKGRIVINPKRKKGRKICPSWAGESSQGKQYRLGTGRSTRVPVIWSPAELGL